MSNPMNIPKVSVEAIVERILTFRQITTLDQRLLKSALLSQEPLSYDDQIHLNRVFEGIRSGFILVSE